MTNTSLFASLAISASRLSKSECKEFKGSGGSGGAGDTSPSSSAGHVFESKWRDTITIGYELR